MDGFVGGAYAAIQDVDDPAEVDDNEQWYADEVTGDEMCESEEEEPAAQKNDG